MSQNGLAMLRQHTEEEWLSVKTLIEQLYIQDQRPLSTVMRLMETKYNFKASIAMYKRKLRVWGCQKNSPRRTRRVAGSIKVKAICAPRYVHQNAVDESLHNLLDLFTPWITQASIIWATAGRMHCPPRAIFVYDEFARGIAVATAAFDGGRTGTGGEALRQAFVDLERTLQPQTRSKFTLHSLFFALVILNQSGRSDASRMLLAHASSLVGRYMQEDACVGHGKPFTPPLAAQWENNQKSATLIDGGHMDHPLPQILNQLQILAAALEGDHRSMTAAIYLVWSVYHRVASTASARSVSLHVAEHDFWSSALRTERKLDSMVGAATKWIDTIEPVLHYQQKLVEYAKANMDNDAVLMHLDNIVSVYSFSKDRSFERTALDLVRKVEEKCRGSASENLAHWESWGCNASLELARFYQERGEMQKSIHYIGRIVPAKANIKWKAVVHAELNRWQQEQSV